MSAHAAQQGVPPPINWWAWQPHAPPMGWFLLDFALFTAILGVVLVRPLKRTLVERREGIERSIAEAARLHGTAVRRQAECRARLAGAQAEAAAVVADSQQEGAAGRAQMVAQARATSTRLAADAGVLAEQHARRVVLGLRAQMARAIVDRAGTQVRAQLDAPARDRLVERATHALAARPSALPNAAGPRP